MTESLLEPAFLQELEALRRHLVVRARSGGGGDHLSKKRGGSAEFLEHRGYVAGDDPRRVDWLAFARTGEPVTKLFRSEEDVIVRIVIDTSKSLEFGTPTKLQHGKRLAAGIGYIALAASERAQILTAGNGRIGLAEPIRGKGSLRKLLREIEQSKADGRTDLAASISEVVDRVKRPGMLVLVSDFLDPSAYHLPLARAASAGHEIVLVQVLAAEELSPTFDGDVALEDVETGELVEITMDAKAVDRYLERLAALFRNLAAMAKKYRFTYVRSTAGEPALPVIRRVLARGID